MDLDRASVFSALAMTSLGLAVGCYFYLKNKYAYWERKGVKGPKPMWLIGNFHKFLRKDKIEIFQDWGRKYGKVFGVYFGTKPVLVVNDADLVNQISIKDFDSFTDHPSDDYFNDYQKAFIFFLKGDHWRRVRALMSPTFTSGKIKRMFRFMDVCADDLVALFGEQIQTESKSAVVNVKDLYCLYTMDAITNCCYAIKLQRDSSVKSIKTAGSRNKFVQFALKVFELNPLRFVIVLVAPAFLLKALNFKQQPNSVMDPLRLQVERIIAQRRKESGRKFDDYLQMLIDAKFGDELDYDENTDSLEDHHAALSKESLLNQQERIMSNLKQGDKSNILSDFEIITSGIFLIVVGVETTATLLTHATLALAHHQEYQERLFEELSVIVTGRDSFSYEALTSCHFLDAILSETLRVFPPFPYLSRVATKDYFFEELNLRIEKGTTINLAATSIMNDPEYFEEPDKFKPDRFMPGRKEKIKPGSYCPFGVGPRHCIGMRFSLTEAKLALAKLVMRFKFMPARGTNFPPEFIRSPFLTSVHNAKVKIIHRA